MSYQFQFKSIDGQINHIGFLYSEGYIEYNGKKFASFDDLIIYIHDEGLLDISMDMIKFIDNNDRSKQVKYGHMKDFLDSAINDKVRLVLLYTLLDIHFNEDMEHDNVEKTSRTMSIIVAGIAILMVALVFIGYIKCLASLFD